MNRNWMLIAPLVIAAAGGLGACGGGSDGSSTPTRAEVLKVVPGDKSAELADCIAGAMLDAGITSGQLDEMKSSDGSGATPVGAQIYRDARDGCGGSAEDVMTSIAEEIDKNP